MPKSRAELIDDYFKIQEALRRSPTGPFHFWHQQRQTVTRAQIGVLILIKRHELNTVKALAKHLGVSASAATQIVNGLVDAKLLSRTTKQTDRRTILLTLTKRGERELKRLMRSMRRGMEQLFKALSNAELIQLITLQNKMLNHLAQS